jgi:hypothetical protein
MNEDESQRTMAENYLLEDSFKEGSQNYDKQICSKQPSRNDLTFLSQADEQFPSLVTKFNDIHSLKRKEVDSTYTCSNCHKTYQSYGGLKKHEKFCLNINHKEKISCKSNEDKINVINNVESVVLIWGQKTKWAKISLESIDFFYFNIIIYYI